MKKTTLMRAAAVSIAGAFVLAACGDGGSEELTEVTFRMDTSILPKHSIFFATEVMGFYEEVGLDVEILPSTGSFDTSVAVGSGQATFGFADAGTMVNARAQGSNVKQLGVIHAQSPFSVVTMADSGIETFEDLKGKTIAGEPAGSTTILFPIALELAGMTEDDLGELVSVDPTAKVPGLLNGDFDATLGYFVSDPPVLVGLGEEPHAILWSDVGFELYSNGLIASDDLIESDPELVEKFVQATLKGVKWACDNQEATAEAQVSEVPEISMEAAIAGAEAACGILWTPEAEENGVGWMTDEGWDNLLEITQEFLGLEEDFDHADVFTNEFNPGILPGETIEAPEQE